MLKEQVTRSINYHGGLRASELELEITDDYLGRPEVEWSIEDENDLGVDLFYGIPVNASRVRDVMAIDLFDAAETLNGPGLEKYAELYRSATAVRGESINEEVEQASSDAYYALAKTPEWKMFESIGGEPGDDLLRTPFAIAELDLSASDDELVTDFRAWLATARQNRGIGTTAKLFEQKDMKQWAHFRVLAYIDLTTWLTARGLTATHQMLGTALFPEPDIDGKNPADQVRRTVLGYAKELTSPDVIRAMQSQYLKMARKNR